MHVVIMAGGQGERFWPRSRRGLPKQFLPIVGGETLFQGALRRARRLVPWDRVHVVTAADYAGLVRTQAPDLPAANLVLEPVGRDTAACVGLAALHLQRRGGDPVTCVWPADHLVWEEDAFGAAMAAAVGAAQSGRRLVTVGLRPSRAETGYGYIRRGETLAPAGGRSAHGAGRTAARAQPAPVHRVLQFAEKPDLATAVGFLQSGDYLWNAGMFAWRCSTLLRAIERHMPELGAALGRIAAGLAGPARSAAAVLRREYEALPGTSVDFGVLEHAPNVVVVAGAFGWDDLGTWPALDRVCQRDSGDNVVRGGAIAVQASRNIIENTADGSLLMAFGVEDLVVVNTGDVVLVADKARAADLKQALAEVRAHGLEAFLSVPRGPGATGRPAGAGRARRRASGAADPTDAAAAADPGDTDGDSGAPIAASPVRPPAATGPVPPGSVARSAGARPLPAFPPAEGLRAAGEPPRIVAKPWGREVWWAVTDRYVGKLIEVDAGQSLSLQYHQRKLETLMFIRGQGLVLCGDRSLPIAEGLTLTVAPGTVHRVEAETEVAFFEVSTPELWDVVRLEDVYGRAGTVDQPPAELRARPTERRLAASDPASRPRRPRAR